MSLKMDLHMHSTYSDGTFTPVELVRKYYDEEYSLIALTDHDGVGGVKEALIAGEALGIQVITGIELGTLYDEKLDLHILGYRIDIENPELLEKTKWMADIRRERNERLLACFNEMGYSLTYDDLLQRPDQTYVGKPNFARALAAKGYCERAKDAFGKGVFLNAPEAKKIKKQDMNSYDAIELIKHAGGTPVLAHPMKIKDIGEKGSPEFYERQEEVIADLKKHGLEGLECYHPSADEEQSLRMVKLADKYHLHITKGSDFHGEDL